MNKKIFLISLLFNFILISGIVLFFFLNQDKNAIENNTIKIVKNSEIIKNSENPKGIFGDEKNLNKNILSGIFINQNTLITAAHGVNNTNNEYEIIDSIGGKNYTGKLIFKDNENDFSKIEIENNFENFKKIKIGKNIEIGEQIWHIGFEQESNFSKTKSGSILEINGNKIKTDIVFQEGNSGGAIYNKNKELIGIALEIDTKNNVGYFLKISDFLN